jgi:DNA-binding NarL/FixJ family response regulator
MGRNLNARRLGVYSRSERADRSGTLKAKQTEDGSGKTRVLILDDWPIVRERIAELVENEPDLMVCGEGDDCRQAMEIIAARRPDFVVTSLTLKNCHGLDFIKDLHAQYPQLLILVFSMLDELIYAERAIRAGARGYIRKQETTKELLHAIRTVLDGEIYMSERVTVTKVTRFFSRSSGKDAASPEQLSDRELQVLQLIGHGESTRQIATALHIDIKTIETYRSRIKIKLNLATAAELADYARKWLEESVRVR